MSADLNDVQRIVLHGSKWSVARTLLVDFGTGHSRHLLQELEAQISRAGSDKPTVQVSVGFTRLGLEHLGVPRHLMARLALKAPAFWAGAPLRASAHLALSGANAPERWDAPFQRASLHMVLNLQGDDEAQVDEAIEAFKSSDRIAGMKLHPLPVARRLPPPPGKEDSTVANPLWVHFGYRDGLSRVGIKGWRSSTVGCKPQSCHQPGEFVLGHANDTGADPWVAGPGLRVWPQPVRDFFCNASFGVLHQLEQDVEAFEAFVRDAAKRLPMPSAQASDDERLSLAKAKLCGRFPSGVPLAAPNQKAEADFDYADDPDGARCPFGSHVRRMNPRLPKEGDAQPDQAAHFRRARPLLRRGLPYGKALWDPSDAPADEERGLIGQFFCASIEDQFEHLLGEWADRVPLGSPDRGGARDPFLGAHEPRDGPFEIPQPLALPKQQLQFEKPFVRTRGVAYLLYPSLSALKGIAGSALWREEDEDDR